MKAFNIAFTTIALLAIICGALSLTGALWSVARGEAYTPEWARILMAVSLAGAIVLGAMGCCLSVITRRK